LITRSQISESEHDGRLVLLTQLMHLSSVHDWQTILKIYTEVVAKIERGLLTWASSFNETIAWAVSTIAINKAASQAAKQKSPVNKKSGYSSRPTFCKDFQTNSCSFTESKHWGMYKGERVQVEHVCATCLMKKKVVAQHSESSSECPNKTHQ